MVIDDIESIAGKSRMGPRRRMRPSATTTALLFIWSGAASAAYLADEPAKAPSRDNERPSDRWL